MKLTVSQWTRLKDYIGAYSSLAVVMSSTSTMQGYANAIKYRDAAERELAEVLVDTPEIESDDELRQRLQECSLFKRASMSEKELSKWVGGEVLGNLALRYGLTRIGVSSNG